MNPPEHDLAAKRLSANGGPAPMPPVRHPGQGGVTPGMASDADLIEDEWVAIAKRIIIENKDDPYNLTSAITLLRADYMKKRYGKDINVTN